MAVGCSSVQSRHAFDYHLLALPLERNAVSWACAAVCYPRFELQTLQLLAAGARAVGQQVGSAGAGDWQHIPATIQRLSAHQSLKYLDCSSSGMPGRREDDYQAEMLLTLGNVW
jgi:hypothetical protein